MKGTRNLVIGASFVAVLGALGVGQMLLERTATAQAGNTVMAPYFEVDPNWPKPLPNGWYQGQTIGVGIDANDHVWIIHRADSLDDVEGAADKGTAACCKMAPPVLEFDQAGNMLRAWGGKDTANYKWPSSNHGLTVDYKGNIWLGGNGAGDGEILKFTQDGGFLLKVGDVGVQADSNSTQHFYMVAKAIVDPQTNEVFVADGYGNRRVAVVDADTGVFKRYWGAYGNKPVDNFYSAGTVPARYSPGQGAQPQYRGPVHCAIPSKDGLVYVCDRTNDRLQVFRRDGTFVKEIFVMPDSLGDGSTWDVAFSKDDAQTYMYLADGRNQKIHIFDRASLTELTAFGSGGHYPGEWYSLHSIETDSHGNLFTTETYQGRRVQKFNYRGLRPVTAKLQGVVWPSGN